MAGADALMEGNASSRRLWLRYIALLVLGMQIGASVFLFLFGHEIDELKIQISSLKLSREKLASELESLRQSEKAAQRKREVTIEEVEVTVTPPKPDPLTEAELIRRLRKDMAFLKGMKAEQVANVHLLLHEMLRKREYVIEGRTVEVQIRTIAIARVLHLFVSATVKSDPVGWLYRGETVF